MARRLTLIAGAGSLVPIIANAVRTRGDVLQVIDIVGRGDIAGDEVLAIPLKDAPALIAAAKRFGARNVVMAGAVHISDADREALIRAFGLVGRLARSLGDVGLAGVILLYCRLNRLKVLGAHQIVPELLATAGLIAGPDSGPTAYTSAKQALAGAKAIGGIDLGQSIVFSGNRAVAAEDAGGTDALLARVKVMRDAKLFGDGSTPLILAKALKPRQPAFADMPAIGAQTVRNAAAAGIGIVVVEAGRSLVLERAELVAEAAALGVSVLGAHL